jgi:hypothetical protein
LRIAHRQVMQFIVPTALVLALPAGCVAHDLVPLRDAVLGMVFVAVLSLCIARAAAAEAARRSERRFYALTHRLWQAWRPEARGRRNSLR